MTILTFKTVFDAMASTLMRFGSAVERLLVIALVVVWGLIAGISTGWADASTIVVNKKVCDATLLPVTSQQTHWPHRWLEGCENLLSTPASTLTYYVIKIEDLIGQTVSVTDNLPVSFTPTSAPFWRWHLLSNNIGLRGQPTLVSDPGPAGAPAYLVIPGYFNALGPVENQAVVTTAGGDVKPSIAHQVYVGTPTPPPGNLKVEKTANITSGSMQGGAGSVTVSYSITVTNTGTNSLNLGGIFELIDNVKALQGSSLGFDYVAQNFQYIGCSPWPTTGISCPELQPGSNTSGMTTNSTTGSVLWNLEAPAGDPGTLPAGSSYTITFDVEYTLNNTVVCTWPGTIDGVRNTAYIRFANGLR